MLSAAGKPVRERLFVGQLDRLKSCQITRPRRHHLIPIRPAERRHQGCALHQRRPHHRQRPARRLAQPLGKRCIGPLPDSLIGDHHGRLPVAGVFVVRKTPVVARRLHRPLPGGVGREARLRAVGQPGSDLCPQRPRAACRAVGDHHEDRVLPNRERRGDLLGQRMGPVFAGIDPFSVDKHHCPVVPREDCHGMGRCCGEREPSPECALFPRLG